MSSLNERARDIRRYIERKVDEWLNDGPEEVVRVLTLWAPQPPGYLPRRELGAVGDLLLEELAEIDGDEDTKET